MAMSNNDILDVIRQDVNAVTALIEAMKTMAGDNAAVNVLLDKASQAIPARKFACQ
jgi:hypothetical protein